MSWFRLIIWYLSSSKPTDRNVVTGQTRHNNIIDYSIIKIKNKLLLQNAEALVKDVPVGVMGQVQAYHY